MLLRSSASEIVAHCNDEMINITCKKWYFTSAVALTLPTTARSFLTSDVISELNVREESTHTNWFGEYIFKVAYFPKTATMFQAVLVVVKVDPIVEKQALNSVCERLARFDDDTSWPEELLQTDETVEVLDEVACLLATEGLCGDSVERSQILPKMIMGRHRSASTQPCSRTQKKT